MDGRMQLEKGIARLLYLKGQCYMHILNEYDFADLSLKQIAYLKKIQSEQAMTSSQLAGELDLSKPTVTEMVKKFVRWGYVYKQSCEADGRVHYLKLTKKGQDMANLELLTIKNMVDQLVQQLDEEDMAALIRVLQKID